MTTLRTCAAANCWGAAASLPLLPASALAAAPRAACTARPPAQAQAPLDRFFDHCVGSDFPARCSATTRSTSSRRRSTNWAFATCASTRSFTTSSRP